LRNGQLRLFLDHDECLFADGRVGLQLAGQVASVAVGRVAVVDDFGNNDCYSVLFLLVWRISSFEDKTYHIAVELIQGVYPNVVKSQIELYLCPDESFREGLCEKSLLLHLCFQQRVFIDLKNVDCCLLNDGFDIDAAAKVAPAVAIVVISLGEGAAGRPVDASRWKLDGFLLLKRWCCDTVSYLPARRGCRGIRTRKGESGKAEDS
jgi:hypothetical protein